MTHPTPPARSLSRRSFCTLSAVALASLALPGSRAFADEAAPTADVQNGPIVIVHTNDVHCAVRNKADTLGYAQLADYVKDARVRYGTDNVTLVDAGDAVQGGVMGTLSDGIYLIDIMNSCKYDLAIPGNHEFDYGMDKFNTLVSASTAKYLSCNFTDLRSGNLMFDSYSVREYATSAGTKRVAFVGICTPESLTKSAPAHFQDKQGNYIYGFCEDTSGEALYAAVQRAVDDARDAAKGNADYVVALAHLGRNGVTPRWNSTAVIANTTGIDVVIDGHSHEEYVDALPNKEGEPVLVTQTKTQFAFFGQVVIDPSTNTISATTPSCQGSLIDNWSGKDADVAAVIDKCEAEIAGITGKVIGRSDVRLVSMDTEGREIVRMQETNLGDFVADAYLALAWNNGIMADVAFCNGGGIRKGIEKGDVTNGNLIDVQPFSNQICCVETKGQNILDALEMGARNLPNPNGGFQQVAGLSCTIRTDVPSSVELDEYSNFVRVAGEYRVRDVVINEQPLDPNKTYQFVSHTYMIMQGGDGMSMFRGDDPLLIDLDNAALIQYIQYNLNRVIGSEYASPNGQGRIAVKNGPDPVPTPSPVPESTPTSDPLPTGKPLASTGDPLAAVVTIATSAAVLAGAGVVSAAMANTELADKR